ncbi:3-ketoacyl-CoA thiolase with broad chain length specificity [Physocladia obscura]|uniref:3-ketoacyl-CoA thiolase with broad chain length specificity n=1 Tax=Physocladia obscura TaxID=109957 RepID=A0AAD5SXJ4_9FUNG|nr:3-ketoacyl-CoA thiolase with broad chain length specificity [Physocladia obscura]
MLQVDEKPEQTEYESIVATAGANPLKTLKAGTAADYLFAVIRDDNNRGISKKGDHMLTLVLIDPCATSSFSVSMFVKKAEMLPSNVRAGQIVKFTNLKIQQFNSKPQGLTTFATKWIFFDENENLDESVPDSNLSLADWIVVRFLRKWYCASIGGDNRGALSASLVDSRRKVITVSQLKEPKECFDLYCQVIHIFEKSDDKIFLAVSDFTKPTFRNGIEMSAESLLYPIPERLFKITIWCDSPEDSESVNLQKLSSSRSVADIEPGMFLFLRNLFSKLSNNDNSLEATLHSERSERSMGGRWQILMNEHLEVVKIRERILEAKLTINHLVVGGISITPAYVPLTSMREMLQAEYVHPTRYRFSASVVDHLPVKFQDFTRVICDYCEHSYDGNRRFLRLEPHDFSKDTNNLAKLKAALGNLWDIGQVGQPRVMAARKALFCVQSFIPSPSVGASSAANVRYKLIATELVW